VVKRPRFGVRRLPLRFAGIAVEKPSKQLTAESAKDAESRKELNQRTVLQVLQSGHRGLFEVANCDLKDSGPFFEVAHCDLKGSASSFVSWNMKSSGICVTDPSVSITSIPKSFLPSFLEDLYPGNLVIAGHTHRANQRVTDVG